MKDSIFNKSQPNVSGSHVFDDEFDIETFSYDDGTKLPPRTGELGLPEVSEVEIVRHFTNLSRENYGVDNGTYPLGSCTMKYNPKINDKLASLSGFQKIHPFQPEVSMEGVWEVMYELQNHFSAITGMDSFSLQPAAGAHGELAGLLIIKQYLASMGEENRNVILIADSAHGTNPATATMAGFKCKIIATDKEGLMDLEALSDVLNSNVAALMLTNPSTLGLFEKRISTIASMIHENQSLLYYDGANLNALMGIVRPGDMGFDVMHINTHKTFSTPHSGGGPGAGPIGVKAFLAEYLPTPVATKVNDKYCPNYSLTRSIGAIKSGFGHFDVLIKAYCYILSLGSDGLKETSENAVLNANYIQASLKEMLPAVYKKYCMHECLLNGDALGVSAYVFAKRLIDYGVHPPTLVGAGCVYFPNELTNALLIEPTETETKDNLDKLVGIFKRVKKEIEDDQEFVKKAPYSRGVAQIPIR